MRRLALCLALAACAPAWAALPDFLYVDRMVASPTQAIVTVLAVKTVDENDWSLTREASMRVEASIALPDNRPAGGRPPGAPPRPASKPQELKKGETLTVRFSEAKPDGNPPPGSPLTFRVKEGERAVLTADGEGISSYTVSSKDLEEALRKEPARIRLNAGGIALEP